MHTRVRVVLISVIAGVVILALKFWAFRVSGSAALKSDAIESIVNVLGAMFALGAVVLAEKPADRDHPYGHGKIEHFSSAFEGGLIAVAAILILYEAARSVALGPSLRDLNAGLLINLGAGALNGLLGAFLLGSGKKHQSRALIADGRHVLSDFYNTLAIAAGLLLVKWTGWLWLDTALAFGLGLMLAYTGFQLVRESWRALLDTEDEGVVERLVGAINRVRPKEVITVHGLRTLRTGRYVHVDLHVVVPEFFEVRRAHDLVENFGAAVIREAGMEGEFHSHVDPCHRAFCRDCGITECPIRRAPFSGRKEMSSDEATSVPPEDR